MLKKKSSVQLVVEKFDDEQEAIEIANDSEYGLAGGIFTTDIHRALNVAKAMRTGRIWINTYNQTCWCAIRRI